jgi:hypothetical protein
VSDCHRCVCVWHLCEKPMNEYLCTSKPRGIFSPTGVLGQLECGVFKLQYLSKPVADPDPDPDPDPPDPRVFGPPGSDHWSEVWIRIRILLSLSKNGKKNLDF